MVIDDGETVLARGDGPAASASRAGLAAATSDAGRGRARRRDAVRRTRSIAPLVVQGERIGRLAAFYGSERRLRPEDTRVVSEVASLVVRPGRAVGAGRAGGAPGAGRAARAARPDLAALHLQRAGRGGELDPHATGGGARAADRVRRVHPLRVPRQPLLRDARRRAALRREVPAARAGALRRPAATCA